MLLGIYCTTGDWELSASQGLPVVALVSSLSSSEASLLGFFHGLSFSVTLECQAN